MQYLLLFTQCLPSMLISQYLCIRNYFLIVWESRSCVIREGVSLAHSPVIFNSQIVPKQLIVRALLPIQHVRTTHTHTLTVIRLLYHRRIAWRMPF